jgi:hypothetical protein
MLARVNSGELILNRAQQNNLAGALTSGGGVPREITLRARGKDLVAVIDIESIRRSWL